MEVDTEFVFKLPPKCIEWMNIQRWLLCQLSEKDELVKILPINEYFRQIKTTWASWNWTKLISNQMPQKASTFNEQFEEIDQEAQTLSHAVD